MFKLRRFLKHYKKELILGPFFKLLEAIFELAVPLVMAQIIDKGIGNNDSDYVLVYADLDLHLHASFLPLSAHTVSEQS